MIDKKLFIKLLSKNYIKEEQELLEMAYMKDGDFNFGHQLEIIKNRFRNLQESQKINSIKHTFKIDDKNFNIHFLGEFLITSNELLEIVNIIGIKHVTFPKYLHSIYNGYILCVNAMETEQKYRKMGIAKSVISFLINEGFFIMGDSIEYENARKLWLSLNKIENYKLDIVSIEEDKILFSGVKLKDIYDNRLWTLEDRERNNGGNLWERINSINLNTRAIIYRIY